jgi:dihydroorotate dehydrogenase
MSREYGGRARVMTTSLRPRRTAVKESCDCSVHSSDARVSLYTAIARPLLFRLDPERAHDLTMRSLTLPGVTQVLAAAARPSGASGLGQRVLGLDFANPVGLAAGLDKQGTAVAAWPALGFGFAEIGTVTPRPQPGNPRPRLFRLPDDLAVINRFGFNSAGAEAVAENLREHGVERPTASSRSLCPLGINVGKNKDTPNEQAADDYVRAIERLRSSAGYFVVNVSSPNTAGLRALQDHAALRPLLQQCVAAARDQRHDVPVLVKVSPDMTTDDLLRTVDAALEGGAAGIVATNTTTSRGGLKARGAVVAETGGLSGAPLRQTANAACGALFRHLGRRVPIVGVGGIASADDAYERIRSGATLVQVYTALIYEGPGLVARIIDGLAERLARDGFSTIGDAIGTDVH